MEGNGFIKTGQPCWCGEGSDNTGVNKDGSAHCFRCNKHTGNYEAARAGEDTNVSQSDSPLESSESFKAILDRKISEETCKAYGVKVAESDAGISRHDYPYFDPEGREVAVKHRYTKDKRFVISGDSKLAGLFGQQLFKGGGKYLTIVEGELDAMAAHQMLSAKYSSPVVSVKNGAGGAVKDIKAQIEYIESFDNIILCFDMDKPGQEAALKVAKFIKPGKCKIMRLPSDYKDANQMLIADENAKFISAFWNAKLYTPSGILNISTMKEKFLTKKYVKSVPFPWEGLNRKLYGLRKKELITFTGGAGLGKSSVTREIEHHLLSTTRDNVGVVALEESWEQTTMGVVSIEANVRLFVDSIRQEYDEALLAQHYVYLFEGENENRFFVHAHLGVQDTDSIFAKLRYLVLGCDCQWLIIDHLHMLVAGHTEGDERRTIDDIMLRLRSLVEETGCGMVLVSHLSKPQGDKGYEQGHSVSLSNLRGSASIGQVSDTVIALERDQQSEDINEAMTSTLRVLKARHTGDTGIACYLKYSRDTGRLTEVEDDLEFSVQGDMIL